MTKKLTIRRSDERGHANHGWLDSYHTFSFANYYDPAHMGFRSLRVINQDRVEPGRGFPTHPLRDMEIFSYILEGAIAHRDSMGNGRELLPGEIQLMSAGTGVTHSEFNPRDDERLHLLQIWIMPNRTGGAPRYQERDFSAELDGDWRLVASPDGADGSLEILQDARVSVARLSGGAPVTRSTDAAHVWVQVAQGTATVNGHALEAGDAIYGAGVDTIEASSADGGELLLFELPD